MIFSYVLSILTIFTIVYKTTAGSAIVTTSDNDKHFHGRIRDFVRRRCLINSNEAQLEQALTELRNIKECFKKKFPTHTESDNEGLEERCLERRTEVIKCMKRLVDFLEPCLHKEEKYLPEFVLEAYEGFSDYFCRHINMLTLQQLIETKMAKCINTFNKNKDIDPTKVCFDKSKIADQEDESITKEELCIDLDDIYNCYEHQFKEHCPDSPKAWEFESGLLNGIRKPCKEEK